MILLARHGAGYRNLLEDEQRAYLAAEYQAGFLWDYTAYGGGDGKLSLVSTPPAPKSTK